MVCVCVNEESNRICTCVTFFLFIWQKNIQKFVGVLQDLGCFAGNKWFTSESLEEVTALELQADWMESIKDAFYMPFCEQTLKRYVGEESFLISLPPGCLYNIVPMY